MVFVRNGTQVIKIDIQSKEESVLIESGQNGIKAGVVFQTPYYNQKLDAVAVTLRGVSRGTAVIYINGKVVRIGGGCQLLWLPDDSAEMLCYVDHEGHDFWPDFCSE